MKTRGRPQWAKFAGSLLAVMLAASPLAAQTVLKASHQFPGGKGDPRDEMVQIIAREVEKANVGLKIQVFPGSSLFKPKEQWNAMARGLLDMSAFPLDYASGQHPEFSATLMPGLVGNYDRAKKLNNSEFMTRIKKVMSRWRGCRHRRCLALGRICLQEELHYRAGFDQGAGDARGRPRFRADAGGGRGVDLIHAVQRDL